MLRHSRGAFCHEGRGGGVGDDGGALCRALLLPGPFCRGFTSLSTSEGGWAWAAGLVPGCSLGLALVGGLGCCVAVGLGRCLAAGLWVVVWRLVWALAALRVWLLLGCVAAPPCR